MSNSKRWRCPCGEDCEVVDYPTGVRSCGNVTPPPPRLRWICAGCGLSPRDCDDDPEHDCVEALLAAREADRRELERHRHGVTVEGDFVCPDSLRMTELESALRGLRGWFAPGVHSISPDDDDHDDECLCRALARADEALRTPGAGLADRAGRTTSGTGGAETP